MNTIRQNTKASKVHVNGVELGYQVSGNGGCDLLFVHGYSARSTGNLYSSLYEHLLPHFRITALDMRGHGGSAEVTEHFTLDQLAEDVLAVCQTLNLDRPLYVGHSLGGLIGLAAEIKAPGLFRGLVLLTPAAATGAKATQEETIDSAVRNHRNKEAMRANNRAMYVRDISEADLSAMIETACLVDPALHERWLRVEWPQVDISGHLREIVSPVLLVNGARDTIISPEEQHQTALSLPRSKEVIFSDEGHLLPLEAPARAAREIINFYKNDLGEG